MTKLIRIGVISDMHAFGTKENSSGSVLDYTLATSNAPNPLRDLIKMSKSTGLKTDLLVCAGDIANRADALGLIHAWKDLQELAKELGGAKLIPTNGNHDLDSRFLGNAIDPDPKGVLLALDPPFPFDNLEISNQYWARNFAVLKLESGVTVAVLNTSAYHGGKQEEIDHGRVSKRTITELCKALEDTKDSTAHILVCHHHPLPLKGWNGSADMEYIRNGQELLDGILAATSTSWLVIHGHRHLPRLVHGASHNNDVPFVFGAGSLGARITGVANQFHIVTLHVPPENDHASISGVVETWFWSDSTGWGVSHGALGLPIECGFGYRGQVKRLAKKVADSCEPIRFMNWSEVQEAHPAVSYLLPDSFNEFESELDSRGIKVMRDKNGRIIQIGK